MAFSKISYLTASETSTNLFWQHYSGYYVFYRWEAACWKRRVKRFCVPDDREWQGLGFSQFLACCSTLHAKHKAQMQLQAFSPFCKLAVVQPFRDSGCNASFNSLHPCHQSLCFPTLTLQRIKPPQHTHTQSCLWACSANRIRESIHIKNNRLVPQRTVWDWRVCQASRK